MMAGIDILNLEPSVISRDLRGKFVCLYSLPKVGKTSLACQFPKNLLCGFEHGWNAISGAMAVDIKKWADFKLILRQLEKPEAQEKYNTITIDTVGIAWDLCEQYICAQHGVQTIADIPWGGGYTAAKREFETCLRKITQLGYGLVVIAHVEKRIEKRADDSEVEILGPAIPKRAYDIVNQLVDIIGYIDITWDEDGNAERWLYTRKTPTVMAGSRFKYLAPKIPFGYDELTKAIGEAIDREAAENNTMVIDHHIETPVIERSFEEIREEARILWDNLIKKDTANAEKIGEIIQEIFGRPVKLSEITKEQKDLFELVVVAMKEL